MKPGSEISFDDAVNVRDLGGYISKDGRHVQYGYFYRGVALDFLKTQHDYDTLDSFHLKTILDLRSQGEADAHIEYIPDHVDYIRICGTYYDDGKEIDFSPQGMMILNQKIKELKEEKGDDLKETDVAGIFYKNMPYHNPAFIKMFECLENKHVPLYFHCSAGKDRTGMAAILILLCLDVSVDQVVEDYLLTNVYRHAEVEEALRKRADEIKENPALEAQIRKMMGVNETLIRQVIDGMFKRYGDLDTYFEKEFGLDQARRNRLKNMYLK